MKFHFISVLTCLPLLEGMSHCQWNRARVTQCYCSQEKTKQNNKTNPQFESTKNNIQDHSWSRSRTISTTATFTQVWHVKSRSLSPEKSGSVFPKEEGIYRHTHTRAYWTLSPIKISKSLWGNSTHAMTGNYKHFKLTPRFFFLVNSVFVFLSALLGYSTLSQMRPNRVSLGSTSSYILWFLQT